ncbi:hypothetical protein [Rhizobium leguminosarum]|uniref:hypothetical protein n=1 Tax=Rhizobium TaxID=379 RepID=UPI0017B28742|nr:hypothetical protein [Rhizobium leguminosarum]MBB4507979.1 hypothetical protein [Rhizobium leguminosarum]
MKFLLPAVCALMSVFVAATSAHACAAPRPFFSELFDADVIVRGTFRNYEVLEPGHTARVTLEILETLKGSVQQGPLSFNWTRSGLADQWRGPNDVIVALMRSNPDKGEDYEVMRGCRVQGIYRTDKYKEFVMGIIARSAR